MVSRRQSIQEVYGVSDCKLSDKIPIVKIFPSKMHIIFSFVQFFTIFSPRLYPKTLLSLKDGGLISV